MINKAPISILGAGAYGTALAIAIARTGTPTYLWGHNPVKAFQMAMGRQNSDRLPGIEFPESMHIISTLEDALTRSKDIIIAVPSHAFREVLEKIKPFTTKAHRIIWATKGFDTVSGKMLSDVVSEVISPETIKGVISGPTFAREMANNMLTAMVLASNNKEFALEIQQRLYGSEKLRIYISDDMIGVQLGGAMKNVIAVAVGICEGINFGANARSALVVRGLSEMIRLGIHLGANPQTFMGMSGVGDLLLTCTDNSSRNLRFGRAVGQGTSVEQALVDIASAVQGFHNAKEVYELAKREGIKLLIIESVYKILYERKPAKQTVIEALNMTIEKEESSTPPHFLNQ